MTKFNGVYWVLGTIAAVMLWVGRQARNKRREVRERMQRREQEFVTEFPQLAAVLDKGERRAP